jgi:putative peptide-modifying radical SAM enzyme|eukprot:gnl/Ergobibamus_cyprinoides/48.p1 GENE.gnl/Ergobibamus_cyprinoides/48~~gnl/Ergobibamus_cyprinoides/48.p1  ORF type:complete len:398 (+),score=127.56 gnl/Ergobibamus_cyprinoides/48:95-1195(+)
MPVNPTYSLDDIAKFFDKDETPISIVFYGGEPLLNLKFIMSFMDRFPSFTYILQSNTTLLYRLPTEYLTRFACLLVSIDGRQHVFDSYRSDGIYDKVLENVADARDRGYTGHIVARMACSLQTDIYEDVTHLTYGRLLKDRQETRPTFDACYWQLDAQWDAPMDARWGAKEGGFRGWLKSSYIPGIQRLAADWLAHVSGTAEAGAQPGEDRTEAFVPNIVPFSAIMRTTLEGSKPAKLRCGCGHAAFTVTTDGRLLTCPVASGEEWNNMGHIESTTPCQLVNRNVRPDRQCDDCEDRDMCGGRCLYANRTQWWGEEGFGLVCDSVRAVLGCVKEAEPSVRAVLAEGLLPREAFDFPAEAYSLEIIP